MSSRIKARWKLVAGAGAVLVLLLAALRLAAHRETSPPAESGPTAAAAAAPAAVTAPAVEPHAAGATEVAPEATSEAAPETTAETTSDDPGDLSAAPPLPTRDQVRARPVADAPAADGEDQAHDPQQASLDLVERSIERLEAALQAAERAGDDAAARQSRIRIERLRQRRATLQAEGAGTP